MAENVLIEDGKQVCIDFLKLAKIYQKVIEGPGGRGVIAVAVQDAETKEVLIVAYIDETALAYAFEHGIAAFWSTSRNELWAKGLTSGDTLELVEVRINCELDSLLFLVKPVKGGACHEKDATGATRKSCYFRRIVMRDGVMMLEPVR